MFNLWPEYPIDVLGNEPRQESVNMTFPNDLIARSVDNAVWFGVGIFGLLYYPCRIRRDVEANLLGSTQGATRLKKIRICCYFAIGVGVLRILGVLP